MRVFVTGATGFIGSAVVHDLISAGHEVVGLTRPGPKADALAASGAKAHLGDLEDLASLQRGVEQAEGVIHTAFIHDFSKFAENCEIDRRAIEAMGEAIAGSDRPLIVTAGLALAAKSRPATEADPAVPVTPAYPRASEQTAVALAERGLRTTTVRLPPSVHGVGDKGFVPMLIQLAREKGVAAYIGEGMNRWPAVHRLDAARLFRLALEHRTEDGPYHAVDDEGVAFKDIAAVIGRHLDVPVVSKTPEEAAAHFGWFATFAGMSAASSSTRSRERLGWAPEQPGLLADIDQPAYFAR